MVFIWNQGRKVHNVQGNQKEGIRMAFHDWNGDGKRDSQDSFIDYQIYQHCTKKSSSTSGGSHGGGISTFGAIISVIAGLVLQAILYTALDIDVDHVPVIMIIVLWGLCSTLAAVVADRIGL